MDRRSSSWQNWPSEETNITVLLSSIVKSSLQTFSSSFLPSLTLSLSLISRTTACSILAGLFWPPVLLVLSFCYHLPFARYARCISQCVHIRLPSQQDVCAYKHTQEGEWAGGAALVYFSVSLFACIFLPISGPNLVAAQKVIVIDDLLGYEYNNSDLQFPGHRLLPSVMTRIITSARWGRRRERLLLCLSLDPCQGIPSTSWTTKLTVFVYSRRCHFEQLTLWFFLIREPKRSLFLPPVPR